MTRDYPKNPGPIKSPVKQAPDNYTPPDGNWVDPGTLEDRFKKHQKKQNQPKK